MIMKKTKIIHWLPCIINSFQCVCGVCNIVLLTIVTTQFISPMELILLNYLLLVGLLLSQDLESFSYNSTITLEFSLKGIIKTFKGQNYLRILGSVGKYRNLEISIKHFSCHLYLYCEYHFKSKHISEVYILFKKRTIPFVSKNPSLFGSKPIH